MKCVCVYVCVRYANLNVNEVMGYMCYRHVLLITTAQLTNRNPETKFSEILKSFHIFGDCCVLMQLASYNLIILSEHESIL